jgi:hypothetical protein
VLSIFSLESLTVKVTAPQKYRLNARQLSIEVVDVKNYKAISQKIEIFVDLINNNWAQTFLLIALTVLILRFSRFVF